MTGFDGTLSQLVTASLIRPLLNEPESSFRFRHTLDQQTAYHSILRKERERIHKLVGQAMERADPDGIAEQAAVLAEHFAIGGDSDRALKYYTIAGDQAGRVYAHTEALAFYDRALELAQKPQTFPHVLKELFIRRGRTLELAGDYRKAMENYRHMEAEGQRRGDVELELAAMTRQTTLLAAPSAVSDPEAGHALALRSLELAEAVGDQESQARAHWSLVLTAMHQGLVAEGQTKGEIGLEMARELGLDELMAFIANDLSSLYIADGNFGRANELLEDAIEVWRRLDNLPMLVDSLTNMTGGLILNGEHDLALENSIRARQIADRIDNRWAQAYSSFMTEVIYAERGEFAQALAVAAEQLRLGAEAGFQVPAVASNAFRAWLFSYLGAWEEALEAAFNAERAGRQIGGPWLLGAQGVLTLVYALTGKLSEAHQISAEIGSDDQDRESLASSPIGPYWVISMAEYMLAKRQPSEGLAIISQLIQREKEASFHFLSADCFELQARLYRISGNVDQAYFALDQAQAEANLLASRRMLWIVHAQRAVWLEEDGKPQESEGERQQASPDFEFILDHLGDENLKRAFLASPRVTGLKMA